MTKKILTMDTEKPTDDTNDRVQYLLINFNLSPIRVATLLNKPPITIYRIINKQTIPSKTTLRLIADALEVNYNWLLTGRGEMMAPLAKTTDPYRDALIKELKDQVVFLRGVLEAAVSSKSSVSLAPETKS